MILAGLVEWVEMIPAFLEGSRKLFSTSLSLALALDELFSSAGF